jgi:hypothetical protein
MSLLLVRWIPVGLVVLGKEGDVKCIYQGHPQINTEDKPFDPKGIVATSVGNVIVADSNNHTIHAISGGGELLTYKVMSDHGVKLPLSLDIDTCICQFVCIPFIHDTQYNVIVISKVDSSWL